MARKRLATTSLAGCFGCHMSILDLDERLLELADLVVFDRSPIDDLKHISQRCDIGLIEGGCCNTHNVEVLREFRAHCDILVALGDCATMGGIPASRNTVPLEECLNEAYRQGPTVHNPMDRLPDASELPLLLNKVVPCHEVVTIDAFLPGCPPSADAIWTTLSGLITGDGRSLPQSLIKYD